MMVKGRNVEEKTGGKEAVAHRGGRRWGRRG